MGQLPTGHATFPIWALKSLSVNEGIEYYFCGPFPSTMDSFQVAPLVKKTKNKTTLDISFSNKNKELE